MQQKNKIQKQILVQVCDHLEVFIEKVKKLKSINSN